MSRFSYTFNKLLKILYLCLLISVLTTINAEKPNKIVIAPYFLNDPSIIEGIANGNRKANKHFGNNCSGFVSRQANAHLEVIEDLEFLKVYVESKADTTLVVKNERTGEVFCNDNVIGTSPEIGLAPWVAGNYSVYVGRSQRNSAADFKLVVTEFQSYLEEFAALDEDASLITIAPDFSPDPYAFPFEAGGESLASNFGFTCKGYIADKPDHVIKLAGLFEYLRIYVESEEDTTLVMVSRLTSRSYCNDDATSFNPVLTHRRMPAGTYDIYVGMHQPNQRALYTLYISQKEP